MGKAKKERTCQMKISNWRKIIYGKLKGTKMNHLECFFFERKVHQLVLKDKIPCPHSSCEKDPQVFQRNGISPCIYPRTVSIPLQLFLSVLISLHLPWTPGPPPAFLTQPGTVVKQLLQASDAVLSVLGSAWWEQPCYGYCKIKSQCSKIYDWCSPPYTLWCIHVQYHLNVISINSKDIIPYKLHSKYLYTRDNWWRCPFKP